MAFGDSHSAPAGLTSSFGEALDSWTLPERGLARTMVRLDNLVYFAPEIEPEAQDYSLQLYGPTSHFNLPFRVYSAVPLATKVTRTRTRSEVQDALPSLYLFEVASNVRVYPTLMYKVAMNAASSLEIPRLTLETLTDRGLVGHLMFRNPHFVIHQIPGLLSSLCVTSLGDRLHSILTTF